jgi:chloramphenicol 3-O phosphotransferase
VQAIVIVLNGASSSGKTSLGRCLQQQLGPGWLLLGVDDLLRALLPAGDDSALFAVSADGRVQVTEEFRRAEGAWYAGLAEMARSARGLLVDEVLLDGDSSQARLAVALGGLAVVWVGVVCDKAVGVQREQSRGDRAPGMHVEQRERVHRDVRYDHIVDTTTQSPDKAAAALVRALDLAAS